MRLSFYLYNKICSNLNSNKYLLVHLVAIYSVYSIYISVLLLSIFTMIIFALPHSQQSSSKGSVLHRSPVNITFKNQVDPVLSECPCLPKTKVILTEYSFPTEEVVEANPIDFMGKMIHFISIDRQIQLNFITWYLTAKGWCSVFPSALSARLGTVHKSWYAAWHTLTMS